MRRIRSKFYTAVAFTILFACAETDPSKAAVSSREVDKYSAQDECALKQSSQCSSHNSSISPSYDEDNTWTNLSPDAIRRLADSYMASGANEDAAIALRMYRRSFNNGDFYSGQKLAELLTSGKYKDVEKAISLYHTLAEKDPTFSKYASYNAARLLEMRGSPGDVQKAQSDFVESFKAGNPWAAVSLVWMNTSSGSAKTSVNSDDLVKALKNNVDSGDDKLRSSSAYALASIYMAPGPYNETVAGLKILGDLAQRTDKVGEEAKLRLALYKLVSGDDVAKSSAASVLQNFADKDSGEAQFALGRSILTNASPDDDARGIQFIKSAIAGNPVQAAYGWYLIADAQRITANSRQQAKTALESYRLSAEAGNGWAYMRIAQMWTDGSLGNKAWKKASEAAHSALSSKTPEAGLSAILYSYGTPLEPSAEELVTAVKKTLATQSADEIAEELNLTSDNMKVKFAQATWKTLGIYDKPVDGIFDRSSLNVFASQCQQWSIASCRLKIMPKPYLKKLISELAKTSVKIITP